ncbi:MAG: hypothetical protein NTV22_01440 [bacterium]|nr:hypothetical protein [bacterium]
MPLIEEYALTPDVFDVSSYSSAEVCLLHLEKIKEVLLLEGVVRNLRNGLWASQFCHSSRNWHLRGMEILKKLVQQNRLRVSPPVLPVCPEDDTQWCAEAVQSHYRLNLHGIITTSSVGNVFKSEDVVSTIDKLGAAPWWSQRGPSARLRKSLRDYRAHTELILQHANSIMFIDPYLDPSLNRYRDFTELLALAAGRTPRPLFEIHRVCYESSGRSRVIINKCEWERRFQQHLEPALKRYSLSAEVFIWDDFHDRYVISDLIGISVPYGFDTCKCNVMTTWTRLSRDDRDDVQREFDPASHAHNPRGNFVIN